MELPDMSYVDWKRQSKTLSNMNAGLVFSSKTPHFSEDNSLLNGNQLTLKPLHHQMASSMGRRTTLKTAEESRVTMHDVKNYYQDYARQKNLDKYLLNNATVTNVRRVYCCSRLIEGCSANSGNCSESGEQQKSSTSSSSADQKQLCWEVSGLIDNRPDRKKASSLTHKGDLMEFRFWCRYLVLANGASDLHNELNVKGESARFILRSIRELEEKIKVIKPNIDINPSSIFTNIFYCF
jgi:hypothetical protein